jgi:hypothetical protein
MAKPVVPLPVSTIAVKGPASLIQKEMAGSGAPGDHSRSSVDISAASLWRGKSEIASKVTAASAKAGQARLGRRFWRLHSLIASNAPTRF